MWSSTGGSLGGVVAFAIVGVLCSLIGMVYAELTSAYPKVGGEVVYAFEAFGTRASILSQWLGILLWIGLLMVETMAITTILVTLGFPIPQSGYLFSFGGYPVYLSYMLISLGFNALFAVINILGAQISGRIQKWAVYIMLAAAVLFCICGVTLGDASNAQPLFTDLPSVAVVMMMLPGFMSGFNAIPQAAEEGAMPHKMLGKVVIMTVWASVIFYLLVVVGLSFAAPADVRAGDAMPVLSAVNLLFHNNVGVRLFVSVASLLGMLTSWNAAYIAGSRLLTGLGRSKLLPPFFSSLNERNTPTKSILFLFVLSSLIVVVGTNMDVYVSLVNATSLGVVIQWLLVSVCFLRLRRIRPDMIRPYQVKAGRAVGILAILVCLGFCYLYLPIGPSGLTAGEWAFLAGYAVFALVVQAFWIKKCGVVPREERRVLMGLDGKQD